MTGQLNGFRVLDASNNYSPLSYYLLYLTEKGLRAKASGIRRSQEHILLDKKNRRCTVLAFNSPLELRSGVFLDCIFGHIHTCFGSIDDPGQVFFGWIFVG